MTGVVTRFAPSPTGRLHLGHAYSALYAFEAAMESGGRFLLRIEDIDLSRCRDEFVRAIFEDLQWLGLKWEEPVRRQSEHFADYAEALDRLRDLGVVYPCFCTRKDIAEEIARASHAPHGPDGYLYPGTCRRLSDTERQARLTAGHDHAWRLNLVQARKITGKLYFTDATAGITEAAPELLGDVVLARKEIATSYHLAVTVDDAMEGVTLVTRGQDLFHATHIHRLLQALLGLPVPDYRHHPLLLTKAGQRFAKRDRGETLFDLRRSGKTADDVRALMTQAQRITSSQ